MKITEKTNFNVKGIFHCHTKISFDCEVDLRSLCTALRQEGFNFVALTEHINGISPDEYNKFVEECQKESDEKFLAIPGVEVRCNDGIEIIGIGVSEFIETGNPSDAIAQIHKLGGYAVWPHPLKVGGNNRTFLGCDAIEVLNGKIDGTLVPNLNLVRIVKQQRKGGKGIHAIFGLDLHDLEEPRCAWIECEASAMISRAIIESFRSGQFVNRVANGQVSSLGEVTLIDYFRFLLLYLSYVSWNLFLEVMPGPLRKAAILLSRRMVKKIKYYKINC